MRTYFNRHLWEILEQPCGSHKAFRSMLCFGGRYWLPPLPRNSQLLQKKLLNQGVMDFSFCANSEKVLPNTFAST